MSILWKRVQQTLLEQESPNLTDDQWEEILRQTEELDRSRFERSVSTMKTLLLDTRSDFEKAAIYDLAIWAIGRSVAADGCSSLMLGKYVQENSKIAYTYFPDLPEAHDGTRLIDLTKCNAYTGFWSYDRVSPCIASLFKDGYQQPKNSNGVYYPELRFAVMLNGRHHTSWATFLDDCVVNLEVIRLTPYFDFVSTDGAFYDFENKYHEPQHIRVGDYRMAVLFQLAKERGKLAVPHTADAYASRTRKV